MLRVTLIITMLCAPLGVHAELAGLPTYVVHDAAAEPADLAEADVDVVGFAVNDLSQAAVDGLQAAGLKCMAVLTLEDLEGDVTGLELPDGVDGVLVTSLPDDQLDGRPAWDVECGGAAEGSMEHLMAVKASGERYTPLFQQLSGATDLPVYLAMLRTDAFPEDAQWQYLNRHVLLEECFIDGVFVQGDVVDLRRPRLSTPEPILAGLALQPDVASAAMTILRSRDADALLVTSVDDPATWLQTLEATLDGLQRAEQDREDFAEAVESGDLSIVAAAETEEGLDLSTIHGVAQSFTLEEAATVTGVGIKGNLRGPNPLALDELHVTIRPDAGGEPDMNTVLAEGHIPPAAFADPGFAWGYAELDGPAELEAGVTYWLYGPNTTVEGNSILWQIAKDGNAYPGGHAWSQRYEYTEYDWIFRVLAHGRNGQ